jgi:MEDS: MEthanogen/methylotroph, DcmR Sensory domain
VATVASANPLATLRNDSSAGDGLPWLHAIPYPTSGVGSSIGRKATPAPRGSKPGGSTAMANPSPFATRSSRRESSIWGDLDRRSSSFEFIDAADWYRSPSEALDRYRAFLKDRIETGVSWISVVGGLPLQGATVAEIDAWTRYESIVNLAFATAPVTIVCAYDTSSLPSDVLGDATRAHPSVAGGVTGTANPSFRDPEDVLLEPPARR